MTDNDSDDGVNGDSSKPPPNQQQRKEKKEFPVSLKIFQQHITFTICISIMTATLLIFSFSGFYDENVICGLRAYILYVECLQLAGWLCTETSNMLFPLSDPNTNS